MKIEHIFLDMDGVLVDFATDALRVHGAEGIDWPKGEWSIPKILGLTTSDFWAKIDAEGSGFWANLKPYPWFGELIDLVSTTAPYSILTSPSLSPSCAKGKLRWLASHMPREEGKMFRRFFIGADKHLLAGGNRLLIDDSDANAQSFADAKGYAIRFPRPWNSNHMQSEDPVGYVRQVFEHLESL